MEEKTAIRYDKQLTVAAKRIFGSIVDKAFVTTYDYNSDKDEVMSRLDMKKFRKIEGHQINYGSKTIWIKFTNGKLIEFQNSEWAAITLVNMDKAYEV